MIESDENDLGYGQLGNLHYAPDDEGGGWRWQRSFDHVTLVPVGEFQSVAPHVAARPADQDEAGEVDLSYKRDPHLLSIERQISASDRISREVSQALDRHDPLIGSLLAFGHITDKVNHTTKPVIAYASGQARNRLCIVRRQNQRQGWGDDKQCYLLVPVFVGDQGTWHAPSPIQQVAFCTGPSQHKGILVVRLVQGTFLLRARFTKDGQHANRLKISVLATIPSTWTGTAMHNHASVNPWFAGHFATVSTAGEWQVWEADTRLDPGATTDAKRIADGNTAVSALELDNQPCRNRHDGWARILWVRDADTVVVCDRTKIHLVDVPSNISQEVFLQHASRFGDTLWILDICRNPSHLECVFVLTRVWIYHAALERIDSGKADMPTVRMRVLQKLRHFRDRDDHSLSLDVILDGGEVRVHIVSRISSAITQYRFRDETPLGDSIQNVSDLSLLSLPDLGQGSRVRTITFHSVEWDDFSRSHIVDRTGEKLKAAGIRFSAVFIMLSDGRILQQLVASRPSATSGLLAIEKPEWKSRLKSASARYVGNTAFVVSDSEDEDAAGGSVAVASVKHATAAKDHLVGLVNYERVYERLANEVSKPNSDLSAVIARFDASETQVNHRKLLSSLFEGQVTVSDLDSASEAFQDLIMARTHVQADSNTSTILPVPGATASRLRRDDPETPVIKQLYQDIVAKHVSSLNPAVPGRTRLAREQLARRIAATVSLASFTISPSWSAETDSGMNGDSQQELASASEGSQIVSSQAPPSSPAPTPAEPSTPEPKPSDAISAALQRLSRYTKISTPGPHRQHLPATNPTTLTRLLSHWDPTTDPETYSWSATTARLTAAATQAEVLANLSQRERSRLQRRRQRREDRIRREDERFVAASQSSQVSVLDRVVFETAGSSSSTTTGRGREAVAAATERAGQSQGQGRTQMPFHHRHRRRRPSSSPAGGPSPSRLLSPLTVAGPRIGSGVVESVGGSSQTDVVAGGGDPQSSQVAPASQTTTAGGGGLVPPPAKRRKRAEGF